MTLKKEQPAITVPDKIDVPIASMTTLENGVGLYWLDCSDQDVIRVSFIFHAGSTCQKIPFSASATANMLSEGSRLYNSHQIAEKLDFYGSYYNVSMDRDYVVITFCALSKFFRETMELAREILLYPAFDGEELKTYSEKSKQRLNIDRSKISTQARELFVESLFGPEHPYGVSYPEALYDDLTREELKAFYKEHYTAENCFVVCSGKIKDHDLDVIKRFASDIPSGGSVKDPELPAPLAIKQAFKLHDGVQSAIRIGKVLFPRRHPDFIGMQIVAMVLGGYFGSRFVKNLREEHGYTYGVFSSMVNMKDTGYFAISTEVKTEATQDAIEQIFLEMQRLRSEPISDTELQMVRNMITGEIMRVLDGPFGIADITIETIQNGTDNSIVYQLIEEVRTISPGRIMELARKYLKREDFTTVIVGDSSIADRFL